MTLRLRAELELQIAPDGSGGKVFDPFLGRTITLGPTGAALVGKIDGTRDPDQLLADLIGAGYARDKIEDTLRCLTLLHAIDGIGDGVRARMASIWAGETELVYRALPEARFACQGSGMCCQSYRLGPVTAEEVAAVSALPVREAFPDLPEGELFVVRDDKHYLRSVATGCVFLQDGHLCRLHARFGEHAKPEMCRTYPAGIKLTFEAAVVYNNQQCSEHFVSQAAGPPLIESASLLRQRRTGQVVLFHPIVFLREDTPVDYAHFLELERVLRDVLGQGAPFRQLAHALDVYDSFITVARSFPLGTDPAAAFAQWRGSVATQPSGPASHGRDFEWDEVLAMLSALILELETALVELDPASVDHDMVPLITELLPGMELLRRRATERAGTGLTPSGELAAALRTSLAQRFQGPLSLPADRPLSAIGEAALSIAAAFACASLRGRPGDVATLGRGHALANRVLPTFTTPMFRKHPERVRALVTVLDRLCA
ncbi:MAG: YkgJ family cysteine cluster protein [Deltaproteobacteria bacterium]|nr:YkgJ family cysteine cluster protein [Deltaproteobacteria bacterium]